MAKLMAGGDFNFGSMTTMRSSTPDALDGRAEEGECQMIQWRKKMFLNREAIKILRAKRAENLPKCLQTIPILR